MANAVLHGSGEIELRVEADGGGVKGEVIDEGGSFERAIRGTASTKSAAAASTSSASSPRAGASTRDDHIWFRDPRRRGRPRWIEEPDLGHPGERPAPRRIGPQPEEVLAGRADERGRARAVVLGDVAAETADDHGRLARVLVPGQVGRRGHLVGQGDPGGGELAAAAVAPAAPVVQRREPGAADGDVALPVAPGPAEAVGRAPAGGRRPEPLAPAGPQRPGRGVGVEREQDERPSRRRSRRRRRRCAHEAVAGAADQRRRAGPHDLDRLVEDDLHVARVAPAGRGQLARPRRAARRRQRRTRPSALETPCGRRRRLAGRRPRPGGAGSARRGRRRRRSRAARRRRVARIAPTVLSWRPGGEHAARRARAWPPRISSASRRASRSRGVSTSSSSEGICATRQAAPAAAARSRWRRQLPGPKVGARAFGGVSRRPFVPMPWRSGTITTLVRVRGRRAGRRARSGRAPGSRRDQQRPVEAVGHGPGQPDRGRRALARLVRVGHRLGAPLGRRARPRGPRWSRPGSPRRSRRRPGRSARRPPSPRPGRRGTPARARRSAAAWPAAKRLTGRMARVRTAAERYSARAPAKARVSAARRRRPAGPVHERVGLERRQPGGPLVGDEPVDQPGVARGHAGGVGRVAGPGEERRRRSLEHAAADDRADRDDRRRRRGERLAHARDGEDRADRDDRVRRADRRSPRPRRSPRRRRARGAPRRRRRSGRPRSAPRRARGSGTPGGRSSAPPPVRDLRADLLLAHRQDAAPSPRAPGPGARAPRSGRARRRAGGRARGRRRGRVAEVEPDVVARARAAPSITANVSPARPQPRASIRSASQ